MADEPNEKKAAEAAPPDEPAIPKDRLVAEAHDFLGLTPHVVSGALAKERKQSFTVAEAQELCRKWLKRPASTSKPVEEG